jgi:OmcA/MtrC family decaheme c-type cytochrome
MKKSTVAALLGACFLILPAAAQSKFQYNILSVANSSPGSIPSVRFSVTDPTNGNAPYNIKTHPAFISGSARVFVQIGYETVDYQNTGSLSELAAYGKPTPALPIGVNIRAAVDNLDGTYTVTTSPRAIPSTAKGSGIAAMEGRLAKQDPSTGLWTLQEAVTSGYKYFAITGTTPVARREIVAISKCKGCHVDGLVLHGNNRKDEPRVCVMCHNPNATDVAWRWTTDGPEESIDFKRMIHGIHKGKERDTPLVVVGFQHSVNDFGHVEFPRHLNNCENCHNPGTYGLPLKAGVLGSTVKTFSVVTSTTIAQNNQIDNDPANNLRISPTAAVCSSCHDKGEDRRHMQRNGASFAALQSQIDSGNVRERCATCHGPGKDKDVLKVHREGDDEDEHKSDH